ncbi:HNH endonuclease [Pandoraea commovens]|uniref:HNH nuclease domain-containing protein n=1 Tax=Pandoraea commovens TaxID=2508289 RepID=A0A5E4T2K6_9BURK|nr:HNH endonuclease [Pandoraea commovens]VVD82406.1 hypothetical protein PCO31010_01219 [Pandoraea commovens]
MTPYKINIHDIFTALQELGGEATYSDIQGRILEKYCSGKVPPSYKDKSTFDATIRRKVEDYCPQSRDFDASRFEPKFHRVARGRYKIIGPGESGSTIFFEEQQADFVLRIQKSLVDSQVSRARRLKTAVKAPTKVRAVTDIFIRNADVVAEVLFQAKGYCQRCTKPAPFLRKADGSPYLEVHHKVRLSDGGEDTVENAIALCPNCHRELHFGTASA